MSEKRYVLELTAEELEAYSNMAYAGGIQAGRDMSAKLSALKAQAKADRDGNDLRLPWRVLYMGKGDGGLNYWAVCPADGYCTSFDQSERAKKLMAAAPELLEAVQAAREFTKRWDLSVLGRGTSQYTNGHADWDANIEKLLERALRKVATGKPEPL